MDVILKIPCHSQFYISRPCGFFLSQLGIHVFELPFEPFHVKRLSGLAGTISDLLHSLIRGSPYLQDGQWGLLILLN